MYCTTPAQSTLLSTHETIRYHAAALLSSEKNRSPPEFKGGQTSACVNSPSMRLVRDGAPV